MAIVSDKIRALNVTFKAAFMQAYTSALENLNHTRYCAVTDSAGASNIWGMMFDSAMPREFVDERVLNEIDVDGTEFKNKTFELTYALKRDAFEDDLTKAISAVMSRIMASGGKYPLHYDSLAAKVLRTNAKCVAEKGTKDLFATDHKANLDGSITFSNTDTGSALSASTLAATQAKMLEVKGADGEPINNMPTTLIVPPALKYTAEQLAKAAMISNTSNIFAGTLEVICVPQLGASYSSGSDTTWYLADTKDPMLRGVVIQERVKPELVTLFNPNDVDAFYLDKFVWGSRARYEVFGGVPHKIFRRQA